MTDPSTMRPERSPVLARTLRRVLPRTLYQALRAAVMNLFTPFVYAAQHGYYRSAVLRRVVGGKGTAAPWMTFPLITFLDTVPFAGRSVLEFGSGYSTIWWGARAEHVVALETDPEWTKRVAAEAGGNVELVDMPLFYDSQSDFDVDVKRVLGDRQFDVVVVDGGDRVKALQTVPNILTADGFVILDDLDLFRDDPAWVSALESLQNQGFGQIDFYGLAVAVPFSRRRRCTSILFRDGSFVVRKQPHQPQSGALTHDAG